MRFEVPQFIDIEDKIFGPFTLKQFIYLAGGFGLGYAAYKIAPFPFSWILIVAFVGFGCMLAFYKVNNRPFIEVVQSFLTYRLKNRLYIWKRAPVIKQVDAPKPVPVPVKQEREITEKDVTTLAQNLDILDQR